ncbi:MAG: class I SAM-dependent methyltransferase, partial [Planctomycetes bacterium]|nr:class I SAM-dependent methyltransferase [Planctomycetota bacterium]
MKDLFEQPALLRAYDRILPVAKHYRDVLGIHLRELAPCNEIIDLGCGTGIPTIDFLKAGKRVTAVDISTASLRLLRKKTAALGYSQRSTLHQVDVT